MKSYLDLLTHVMNHGIDREDRTGVGTRGVFGYQWRHNLQDGFPLLTTKQIHTKSVIYELLWFLRGDTNVKYLNDHGVTIWDEWAGPDGDLGPVYGKQWRRWTGGGVDARMNPMMVEVDQIEELVFNLRTNPFSRRHIVSAWNAAEIEGMAIPPCHTLFQCYVSEGGGYPFPKLSLHLYARSIDSFLGLPFNIASYSILLSMLACVCDMIPYELIISFGDLHIYRNHFPQVAEQLAREPRILPVLNITHPRRSMNDWKFSDFEILDYTPHPKISAPVAV